jgi:MYXO-CTERM domain-containing protein
MVASPEAGTPASTDGGVPPKTDAARDSATTDARKDGATSDARVIRAGGGGCNCHLAAPPDSHSAGVLLTLGLAGMAVLRRRRRR